jgi:ABC-type phosphate/phosphonate transport system substrate-binding protein
VESREAVLEGIDQALLLTESDHFNALAAHDLRRELGVNRVYRVAPDEAGAVQDMAQDSVLFAKDLTFVELTKRFEAGAKLAEFSSDQQSRSQTPLFVVTGDRELRVVTAGDHADPGPNDRTISLVER